MSFADAFHLRVIEGSGKNTALPGDTPIPHRLVDQINGIFNPRPAYFSIGYAGLTADYLPAILRVLDQRS